MYSLFFALYESFLCKALYLEHIETGGRKMGRRKNYRRILCVVLFASIICTVYYLYDYLDKMIPNRIHLIVNEEEQFNFNLPIEAEIKSGSSEVSFLGESNIPTNSVRLNLRNDFYLNSKSTGSFKIELKFLGFFHLKDIEVSVIESTKLMPCGFPVGIYLEMDGILVIGSTKVIDQNGISVEPAYNVLKSGDYIVNINGYPITTKEKLIDFVQLSEGREMVITIRRNNLISNIKLTAVETSPDDFKIGVWVRDDTQGIGTLTYMTNRGEFGALGHGVSDVDTGSLLEVEKGLLYNTDIITIIKGESGTPGGLSGVINYQDNSSLGVIRANTSEGIFGQGNSKLISYVNNEFMEIGLKQDIKIGPALIRCQLDGDLKDYKIEITKIDKSDYNLSKGMEIKVVDEELLRLTNGIVQGMSGSPIIQDNKLIGAVTHVFVQDSSKGYGIFIENMLLSAENLNKQLHGNPD